MCGRQRQNVGRGVSVPSCFACLSEAARSEQEVNLLRCEVQKRQETTIGGFTATLPISLVSCLEMGDMPMEDRTA